MNNTPTLNGVLESGPADVAPDTICDTCLNTLDVSRQPVRLPCHHVFCRACIKPRLQEFFTYFHMCPFEPPCNNSSGSQQDERLEPLYRYAALRLQGIRLMVAKVEQDMQQASEHSQETLRISTANLIERRGSSQEQGRPSTLLAQPPGLSPERRRPSTIPAQRPGNAVYRF